MIEKTIKRVRTKNTYHISLRLDGAKRGKVNRNASYPSRKAAIEVVMSIVDITRNITGATIYRQRYSEYNGKPLWLDAVVSMTHTKGIVRWRDVSGHTDAAYLRHYEKG